MALAKIVSDLCQKGGWVDRFDEDLLCAGLDGLLPGGGIGKFGADHQNGNGAISGILLERPANPQTIDAGHHEIEEDEVRVCPSDLSQHLIAVIRKSNLKAFSTQTLSKELTRVFIIINDEYSLRHARFSLGEGSHQ